MIYITAFDRLNIICRKSWSKFDKSIDDIHHNIWPFEYHLPQKLAGVWYLWMIYITTLDHWNIICHYIPNSWPEFDNLWKIYITTYNHLNIICHKSWPEFDIYEWSTSLHLAIEISYATIYQIVGLSLIIYGRSISRHITIWISFATKLAWVW